MGGGGGGGGVRWWGVRVGVRRLLAFDMFKHRAENKKGSRNGALRVANLEHS